MAKKSTSEFAITNLQVFAEEEESTYRQACEPPQISLHRLLRDRSKPLPASTRLRRAPAERPADLLSLVASLFHVVKYLEAVTRVQVGVGRLAAPPTSWPLYSHPGGSTTLLAGC
jgi:hypothetical protein